MNKAENDRGVAALREASRNEVMLKALVYICRELCAEDYNRFSENPYRNAFFSGQRHVALTIREILAKDNSVNLDQVRL